MEDGVNGERLFGGCMKIFGNRLTRVANIWTMGPWDHGTWHIE